MPLLRNAWYVAEISAELGAEMVSRRICGDLVLLYRRTDGSPVALQDRCPHRFVPLSMGCREGDTVRCGYHGLRFGPSGDCVEAPHDADNQNPRLKVRSYPTVDLYGMIWIWMGDAGKADPAAIPDFSFMTDSQFVAPAGLCHFKANHELIADNLLDLSHVHYLHPEVHPLSNFSSFRNEVRVEGETVWSMLWRPEYRMEEERRKLTGLPEELEGQGHTRWDAPGLLVIETAFWPKGGTIEDGVSYPSAHFLTPETEFTTHYFYANARNYRIDDKALDDAIRARTKRIFETQDGPMFESQQADMGESTDFLEQNPVILKADAAGVIARRIMKRRRSIEAGEVAVAAAAQ